MKVLYIKANSKPEGQSRTFMIADAFIEEYQKTHPGDEVITLDLYKENIKNIDEAMMDKLFGEKDENSRYDEDLKYVYQFMEADMYVVATPMWNLGTPAILKAYFDLVSIPRMTFKYATGGSVGLLENKKALAIVTRGGDYTRGTNLALEHTEKFIKAIFNFYGVVAYTSITADNLDVKAAEPDKILEGKISEARSLAKIF